MTSDADGDCMLRLQGGEDCALNEIMSRWAQPLANFLHRYTGHEATAIKLAAGQPGYFVLHCPMLNAGWVQTSPEVSNPYGSAEMRGCGEVVK